MDVVEYYQGIDMALKDKFTKELLENSILGNLNSEKRKTIEQEIGGFLSNHNLEGLTRYLSDKDSTYSEKLKLIIEKFRLAQEYSSRPNVINFKQAPGSFANSIMKLIEQN